MVTYLSGPVLPIILIVLAGIALRYSLWYRASEDSSLEGELEGLRTKTSSLSGEAEQLRREKENLEAHISAREAALNDREGHYNKLRGEYDQLRREYDVLNDAGRQLEFESDRNRQSVEQIEETIATLRDGHEHTESALEQECRRSDVLHAELDSANDTIEKLRDDLDAAGELRLQLDASRENCRDLQQGLERSQETIARLEVDVRFANALREKQTSLQTALNDSTDRIQTMAVERDDLASRLEVAHEEALQLRDQMNERQQRISQLESERDDMLGQLGRERTQREAAEAAAARAEAVVSELNADLESMKQLQVAHQFLQNTVAATQSQMTAIKEQRDSLTTSLSNSQQRISELDTFVATLQKEVAQSEEAARQAAIEKEDVIAQRDRAEAEFERVRMELTSSIADLRQEKDSVVRSIMLEKESVVRSLLEDKDSTVKSLIAEKESAIQAMLEEKDSAIQSLIEEKEAALAELLQEKEFHIAALVDENESVVAQLDSESTSRQAFELELEQVREEIAELRATKETLDTELQREQLSHRLVEKELRDEKEHYAAILEQERLEREEIECRLSTDLNGLRDRIQSAQQAKSEIEVELQEKADYYATIEASLRHETDELRQGSGELRERHEKLLAEMEQERREKSALRHDTDELREQRECVMAELERERDNHTRVESELVERAERLRYEKERTLVELGEERDSRIQLEEALRLHAETLDKLRADSMSLEELLERQAAVQSSLSQHANRLRIYRGEFGKSENKDVVEPTGVSDHLLDVRSKGQSIQSSPLRSAVDGSRFDGQLGQVFDRPPSRRDDLKLISGVGEILEARLNELGVFTFEQVMNWTPVNVEAFSDRLVFNDRIDRDQWIVQARRLYEEFYGRRATA